MPADEASECDKYTKGVGNDLMSWFPRQFVSQPPSASRFPRFSDKENQSSIAFVMPKNHLSAFGRECRDLGSLAIRQRCCPGYLMASSPSCIAVVMPLRQMTRRLFQQRMAERVSSA